MTSIADTETRAQREQAIQQAAGMLRDGGLVVLPTETVYGVAAAVDPQAGVQRLRKLKQRTDDRAFTVHLAKPSDVERYVNMDQRPLLRRLVQRTMPGPITVIVAVGNDEIREHARQMGLPESAWPRVYHQGTIGLRCPDHPLSAELLDAVDVPVVASSANHAGQPPTYDAADAADAIGGEVDMILDGGRARLAQASTIVRLQDHELQILREGILDERYLKKILRRTFLFVCSGNTCRSPMAAAIARREIARRLETQHDALGAKLLDVQSAGVYAGAGAAATPEAAAAVESLGLDLTDHRSQPLTATLVDAAELIFCMTDNHRAAMVESYPHAADKVLLLDETGDIDDPMGAEADTYRQVAARLENAIRHRLEHVQL